MNGSKISGLVGSSEYDAIADGSLKDEDNAAWVMTLDPCIRDEWIERISWIRLLDRLGENALVAANSSEFHKFCEGWQQLLHFKQIKPGCPYQEILSRIYTRWFGITPIDYRSVLSWNRYLRAIAHYHQHNLIIATFTQYELMLNDLGGAFFQVLPFLPPAYWKAAGAFGVLDQFFNNLRDLQEDAQRGICYLPTTLLHQFGVTREEILQQTACQNSGYAPMMEFLLTDYLPKLQHNAQPLITAKDLPPSWILLRDWSLHRYQRIERVLRDCNFDCTRFPSYYWAEVQQDLPVLLTCLQQESIPTCRNVHHAQGWRRSTVLRMLRILKGKGVNVIHTLVHQPLWRQEAH